ncbi:MAG TPA: DUF308 domain-containing protein [Dokdonella sp.]
MRAGLLSGVGRAWWVLVVYGVISILFGLSAIVRPAATAIAFVWAIGVMALAEGLIGVFALFDRDVRVAHGGLVVYALASIAFGLIAVLQPLVAIGALILLLAAWLLVAGVYRVVFAIRVRRHVEGEWLIALSGVLAIALGLMFAAFPLAALVAAAIWIGVGALFYGALQIVAGLNLRRRSRLL